jgi:hypothetical protein
VLPHRDASGALSFAVAIPVDVTPLTVTAKFRVYVDATTLRPIVREQLYKFAGAGVSLRVPERSPTFGERFDAPAPLTNFSIAGVAGQTDAAGVVAWEGVDPVTVDLLLQGPRARVWNDGGPEALLSTTLTDALPHVFDFSADVELDAEVTTYTHAGRVREYARTFAPVLGFLNQQVQATVNIDEYCNAFSDGTSINFYISGQGCQNTGRIADVIYHEYGPLPAQTTPSSRGSARSTARCPRARPTTSPRPSPETQAPRAVSSSTTSRCATSTPRTARTCGPTTSSARCTTTA